MTEHDDKEVAADLRRICAGRRPEYEQAYKAVSKGFWADFSAYFRNYRKSAADIEDLCQSTFLKVLEQACQYAGKGKAAAWLWRIAIHTLYDSHRKRPREEPLPDPELTGGADLEAQMRDPRWDADRLVKEDLSRRTLSVLKRFSVRYHDMAFLRVMLGYDYDEIAPMLGIGERYARQFCSDCMKVVDEIALGLDAGKTPERILADLRNRGEDMLGAAL